MVLPGENGTLTYRAVPPLDEESTHSVMLVVPVPNTDLGPSIQGVLRVEDPTEDPIGGDTEGYWEGEESGVPGAVGLGRRDEGRGRGVRCNRRVGCQGGAPIPTHALFHSVFFFCLIVLAFSLFRLWRRIFYLFFQSAVHTVVARCEMTRRRSRGRADFPLFFLWIALFSFVISLVYILSSWDRPGRQTNGSLQRAATTWTADGKPGQKVHRRSLDRLHTSMNKPKKTL
jgi:hypothetical protein